MTLIIIIISYVLNVFIGRYLNIKLLKYGYPSIPKLWFIPLMNIIVQLFILYDESGRTFLNFKINNRFVDWFLLK